MRNLLSGALTLALLVLAGCNCSPDPLTSPDELTAMQARIEAFAEENLARPCERPVLSGEPTPGDGMEALRKLTLTESLPGGCAAALNEAEDAKPPQAVAVAGGGWLDSRDLSKLSVHDPDFVWMTRWRACAEPLGEVVDAIAQHGSVCAPHAIGRPQMASAKGENYLAFIEMGRVLGLDIALAPAERRLEAIQSGLRFIQLGFDMTRGANLLPIMIQLASAGPILSQLAVRLQRDPEPFGEEALQELDRQLAVLSAQIPDFRDALIADMHGMMMEYFLSAEGLNDWTPPGGLVGGERRSLEGGAVDGLEEMSRQDVAVLGSEAAFRVIEGAPETCSAEHPLERCLEDFNAKSSEISEQLEAIRARIKGEELGALLGGSDAARANVREFVVATIAAMTFPAFVRYRVDLESQRTSLTALRLQIAARRHWETTGACPTLDEVRAWQRFEQPGEGAARFESSESGVRVLLPEASAEGLDDNEVHRLTLRCPEWRATPEPPKASAKETHAPEGGTAPEDGDASNAEETPPEEP